MDSSTTLVILDFRPINCHYYLHTPRLPYNPNLPSCSYVWFLMSNFLLYYDFQQV
jgi:hypothetical protein